MLSTSGFEDGTTEKLTGISYGIRVNLIGFIDEIMGLDGQLPTFQVDLLFIAPSVVAG